jgi:hypothetical protein
VRGTTLSVRVEALLSIQPQQGSNKNVGDIQATAEDNASEATALSFVALSALQEVLFMGMGVFDDYENDGKKATPPAPPSSTAECLARLQAADAAAASLTEGRLASPLAQPLLGNSTISEAVASIRTTGVARLSNVLGSEICDDALTFISASLNARVVAQKYDNQPLTPASGFGNVLARTKRWDMYLPNSGVIAAALDDMLAEGEEKKKGDCEENAPLGAFFRELFESDSSTFHELSSLTSDPGAARQQIHPDNAYQATAPLYTAFVALQDVTLDMGPTSVLLRTHVQGAHESFNEGGEVKESFLAQASFRNATLQRGDALIIDSRVLHCATANSSSLRRCLLYFTLVPPDHAKNAAGEQSEQVTPVELGSMWRGEAAMERNNCTGMNLSDYSRAC